jgi:O-antigen/teichoic acid export membrane protein
VNAIRKLAGQTAVYGLPSIIGRVLNYFLVPIYTAKFTTSEYGIVSEFYAYVAFFVVVLMYGMETTFFRFANKSDDPEKTFNQSFSIVLLLNILFLVSALFFSQSIANWMGYPQYQRFVIWFAFVLTFDALSSLFMAKLRFQANSKKFILVQFASILSLIAFNLIFIYGFLEVGEPDGIAYIFIANLIASVIKPILLYKEVLKFRFIFDKVVARAMVWYATPLMIAGFAGIVNETMDRILLKRLLMKDGLEYAQSQVGIYSANYKLSILISLFIQAFRYAAEPFFFSIEKTSDKSKVYAKIMTYFVIVVSFLFLFISLNLSIFKWFIPNPAYWEGLRVVPLLLLANVFLGIYYNQSIWYKLADKTRFGAYIALGGAGITLLLNFLLIPFLGYMGSAIATLAVYLFMMLASHYFGQRFYPIKYNIRKIGLYLFSSILLLLISKLFNFDGIDFEWTSFIFNLILLIIFIGIILVIERPLQALKKR